MNKIFVAAIILLVIIVGGAVFAYNFLQVPQPEDNSQIVGGDKDENGCIPSAGYSWCPEKQACIRTWEEYCTAAEPKTALFVCNDSKIIIATFYPEDDKFVDLELSDGRNVSVPRAISASGARYANEDESFVFWNKGDSAFITEDNETSFANCAIDQQ